VSAAPEPAPTSALARLQAKRKDAGRNVDRHVDLLVPDSDDVYVRFCYLEPDEVAAIRKRVVGKQNRDRPGDALRINTAILVEACRGVFVRESRDRLVSIDPDNPSTDPADWPRFDPRLAALLGVDGGGAAEVAHALLGEPWAVMSMAAEYNDWLTPVTEQLDEAHQGE
jgi:hypothetical protein